MISLADVEELHDYLVDEHGGSKGIRDKASLLAAINRPYATFDQQDLYPTPVEKAAAIFESIIINHPFIDGNKRTAYTLLRFTLLEGGFDIKSSEEEKYKMTIASSKGDMRIEEIKHWINERIIYKQK